MITKRLTTVFKEPIVQFTLLGVLLFGLDHFLVVNRDDPNNVIIDDRQLEQLIDIFEEGQGRSPSGREINNMVIAWAQNEILYREARSMGLDRGDDMIRNRLILKIRNVLFNNVIIDHPSEEQLQQFFEFNQAAYQTPERYDLEMIALPAHYGLSDARELQKRALNDGMPDSYLVNRYRYQNRGESNLAAMFGSRESAALLSAGSKGDSWTLITNEQGHHLARITARHKAIVPSLNSVRSRVIQDWERYAGDRQVSDQTYSIARQYQVHLELSDTHLESMERDLPENPFDGAAAASGATNSRQTTNSESAVDGL